MAYIVRRQYGRSNADYLIEWDIIWGPVWSGLQTRAIHFSDPEKAREAAFAATECMKPVPWIVPDFGARSEVGIVAVTAA